MPDNSEVFEDPIKLLEWLEQNEGLCCSRGFEGYDLGDGSTTDAADTADMLGRVDAGQTSLDELAELRPELRRRLKRSGISTIEQLASMSTKDFLKIQGIGEKKAQEIEASLRCYRERAETDRMPYGQTAGSRPEKSSTEGKPDERTRADTATFSACASDELAAEKTKGGNAKTSEAVGDENDRPWPLAAEASGTAIEKCEELDTPEEPEPDSYLALEVACLSKHHAVQGGREEDLLYQGCVEDGIDVPPKSDSAHAGGRCTPPEISRPEKLGAGSRGFHSALAGSAGNDGERCRHFAESDNPDSKKGAPGSIAPDDVLVQFEPASRVFSAPVEKDIFTEQKRSEFSRDVCRVGGNVVREDRPAHRHYGTVSPASKPHEKKPSRSDVRGKTDGQYVQASASRSASFNMGPKSDGSVNRRQQRTAVYNSGGAGKHRSRQSERIQSPRNGETRRASGSAGVSNAGANRRAFPRWLLGFRSGKKWKKILAGLWYVLAIIQIAFSLFVLVYPSEGTLLNRLGVIVICAIPLLIPLLLSDLPIYEGIYGRKRTVAKVFACVAVIIACHVIAILLLTDG